MGIASYIKSVQQFFDELLHQKCRIITVMNEEDDWKAVCEIIVDTEYTTRKGLGDVVEIYNVHLNSRYEVTGYELVETKKRVTLS